ncbi:MAG: peroxiredoxin [Endozoicomonas sp.]
MSVTLGQPVTDFTAQATSGITVNLSAMKGQNIVLFFYPKDNTPGCTSEGQVFRDLYDQFTDADTVVFGVSRDSLKSHDNFRAKHEFPFELISDQSEELCNLFEVIKLKQMYGKEYMGIERSTFLIDGDGILQHEWRKVRIKGHVEDVLQAAQALGQSQAATPEESAS